MLTGLLLYSYGILTVLLRYSYLVFALFFICGLCVYCISCLMLDVHNFYKTIENTTILNGLSLGLKAGSVVAIIGPSGSGKSTLLQCIAGLILPDAGSLSTSAYTIHYQNGRNTTNNTIAYPELTMVFQSPSLWPHMTIQDNLQYPARYTKKYCHDSFIKYIQMFGIEHIMDKLPHQCSGGEQQRVALIQKLLLRPTYLLLDEITSALDIEHIQTVCDVITAIKNTTAILLVTHYINFAKNIADMIYFMDKGNIIESGGPSMLSSPRTQRLQQFLRFS